MLHPSARRFATLFAIVLVATFVAKSTHAQAFHNDPTCNPIFGGTAIVTSQGTTHTYTTAGGSFGFHQIRLLGSPSGLAHDNGNGVWISLKQSNGDWASNFQIGGGHTGYGGSPELWLTGPTLNNGHGDLVCYEPEIPSALDLDYLQYGLQAQANHVYPSFGGSGNVQIQIKMCDQQYAPIGIFFDGRSTDPDGDGDTDEDDEALLRAAMGGSNPVYDLDWSGAVDAADLAILIAEAKRRVVGAVCALDGFTMPGDGGTGLPFPYDQNRFHHYAPATITNLSVTRISASTVRLSWTAPADDGATGRPATTYEIRRSPSAITSGNFASATVVTAPTPAAPGTTQTLDVTLAAGTSQYFAIRSVDDVDNLSGVSNSPQIQNTAPATITNLTASAGRYMVKLGWTAPGEDGAFGTATSYDARVITGSSLTEANWASATSVSVPTPSVAGTSECAIVSPLNGCTQYSFGIKTRDAAGNWSALSNVKTVTTKCSGGLSYECGGAIAQEVIEESVSLPLSLGRMQPNPVRNGSRFTYAIPNESAGEAFDLGIFDVGGRRVTSLASGAAVPGLHDAGWSLQSDAGSRVRPGVYFVRLRVGSTTMSHPVQVSP